MSRPPELTPESLAVLPRITTHAAIAPGRKHDPGPLFPLASFLTDVGREVATLRQTGAA